MDGVKLQKLIVRIAHGDNEAFEDFFKVYHSRMIRFALLFLNSYQDAEDVVSEVMIKLLRQRQKLSNIKNFSSYLFRAIKNQSLNHKSKKINQPCLQVTDIPKDNLTDSYQTPHQQLITQELRECVINSVEALPPKRRQVYLLIKDEGLPIKEVSGLLEISQKTVKKHLELAMRDLRTSVQAHLQHKQVKSSTIETPVINIQKYSYQVWAIFIALLLN